MSFSGSKTVLCMNALVLILLFGPVRVEWARDLGGLKEMALKRFYTQVKNECCEKNNKTTVLLLDRLKISRHWTNRLYTRRLQLLPTAHQPQRPNPPVTAPTCSWSAALLRCLSVSFSSRYLPHLYALVHLGSSVMQLQYIYILFWD